MGKQGLGEKDENGELFTDFCFFSNLVIGGSVFLHSVHKATWVSPEGRTENQIDHICISSKFRRSLLDVRAKRGAVVPLDHHLLVGKCRLKLKSYNTGMQNISHKYSIRILKDDEINNRFQTRKNSEKGGHIISKNYSIDLRQARCPTSNQPTLLCRSAKIYQVIQRSREPLDN